MLVIRLQKIGRRHQPSYRVVVSERRSKLGGPAVEDLGSYSTFSKSFALQKERALHWLKAGAKPTPTVHNLFVTHGILSAPKIPIKIPKKKEEAKIPEVSAGALKEEVKTETPEETENAAA